MDQTRRNEIRTQLQDMDARAATIRATMDDLRARISELSEELSSNREERSRVASLISPIEDLPDELLADIWDYTRECHRLRPHDMYTIDKCRSMFCAPAILQMSWVCRRWRDVALSTPMLWSDLLLSPHMSLQLMRLKVERSQSCPLDITVECSHYCRKPAHGSNRIVERLNLLICEIRLEIPRWRSFQLFACVGIAEVRGQVLGGNGHTGQPILTACTAALTIMHAPQLVDFRVVFDCGPEFIPELPELSTECFKVLKRVQVYGVDIRSSMSAFTGLVTLDLSLPRYLRPTPEEMRDMVLGSPNLTVLYLEGPPIQGNFSVLDEYSFPVITSSSVRTLRLALVSDEDEFAHHFFNVFDFPNLESLCLSHSTPSELGNFAQVVLNANTKPYFPNLTKFASESNECLHLSLILRAFPTVRHLELCNEALTPFMKTLMADIPVQDGESESVQTVIPLLDTVSWIGDYTRADLAVFRRLIEKRSSGGIPIKKLIVCQRFLGLQKSVQDWFYERLDVEIVRQWLQDDSSSWPAL
ncbi:hypothetical protein OE88DRAFT_1652810 [Heliocybe sulcata]|uniref:Uncharacterized protein n=1 Tax=Heliocybe sulcata TaxID=5364 RepID=A0A5C3NE40_9AGAM|nr:hypothetical protein OE88DRAFT_1652810 [Heliocybe sulcata]